eukprot:s772_g1.t1
MLPFLTGLLLSPVNLESKNLETKGTNSYYYAHNESWEVPEHAKVRSGPGLVTGGAPVKLGADGQAQQAQAGAINCS